MASFFSTISSYAKAATVGTYNTVSTGVVETYKATSAAYNIGSRACEVATNVAFGVGTTIANTAVKTAELAVGAYNEGAYNTALSVAGGAYDMGSHAYEVAKDMTFEVGATIASAVVGGAYNTASTVAGVASSALYTAGEWAMGTTAAQAISSHIKTQAKQTISHEIKKQVSTISFKKLLVKRPEPLDEIEQAAGKIFFPRLMGALFGKKIGAFFGEKIAKNIVKNNAKEISSYDKDDKRKAKIEKDQEKGLKIIVGHLEKIVNPSNLCIVAKPLLNGLKNILKTIPHANATGTPEEIETKLLEQLEIVESPKEYRKNANKRIRKNLEKLINKEGSILTQIYLTHLQNERSSSIKSEIQSVLVPFLIRAASWVASGLISTFLGDRILKSCYNTLNALGATGAEKILLTSKDVKEDDAGNIIISLPMGIKFKISKEEKEAMNKLLSSYSEIAILYLLEKVTGSLIDIQEIPTTSQQTTGISSPGASGVEATNDNELEGEWQGFIDALIPLIENGLGNNRFDLSTWISSKTQARLGQLATYLPDLLKTDPLHLLKYCSLKDQILVPLAEGLQEALHKEQKNLVPLAEGLQKALHKEQNLEPFAEGLQEQALHW